MRDILKKIISILVIFIIITASVTFAVSEKDSENIKDKINQTKDKIEDVQEKKSDTLKEVEDLTMKISQYENEIKELNYKEEDLNTKIVDTEKQIAEKEAEYQEKDKLMKERLVVIYEQGQTSFLDMILSSKSITEFISTYFLLEEITSFEDDLMKEIENSKKEIEASKTELEKAKNEVNNVKSAKQVKNNELQVAKSEKNQYAQKLSSDEQKLQKELEEFERDRKAIDAELAEIARKAAEEQAKREEEEKNNNNNNNNSNGGTTGGGNSSSGGNVASKGYICPIPGLSRSNITCGFYGYANHGGADFGGNYGKSIVAAKPGTVVISKTTTGTIPNYDLNGNLIGSYRSYGEYIAIDHHDGSVTLYAHGLPGSRKVSTGQTVKQGQVIMNVGNTGNVNPRPTPSNPKGGAHLHFEIMINGRKVDPAKYIP